MSASKELERRVIIIGGGVGGIMTAIALKTKLGFHNFTLYEQSDDLGGTWNLNTYPGCASDISTHWYSFSGDVDPDWTSTHLLQPELKKYWKGLCVKYDINKHVCVNTSVVAAEWDNKRQLYRVEVLDVLSGEKRTDYANAVVSAIGVLNIPHLSEDLKGVRETFKGKHFHSARWDHTVDLRNKRVAVIGNGCSAAQFVPIITEDPTTEVLSFARTPGWILPTDWGRKPVSWWKRMIFKYVPFTLRLNRWSLLAMHESFYMFLIYGKHNSFLREFFMNDLRKNIQKCAPEKYHDVLTPKYPFGCKRFIVDTGYLAALHRPNNDLTFDGIAEITEKGILTKKGQHHDFDVIIEATGFVVDEYPIVIRGVDGTSIQDYHREQGGPTAYRGTTTPNFPNFFMLFGPNTTTTHGSVIFTHEVQINYTMQLLEPVLKKQASSFEVTREASDAWNAHVQKYHSTSVWTACQSWYRVGGTGKNVSIWPGSLTDQWYQLRTPVWSDYKATGAYEWENNRRLRVVKEMAQVGGLFAVLAVAYFHPQETLRLATQVKDQVRILEYASK
ncbi:hypothetical protein BXZ70DRAFT_1053127 [Cristinia sonorae]|uniref:Monooxygenase n=1 Tax=Cristinia sonorae TaxID=1940300 RepID=A0A8K0UFQ5_9AGAR|nr:hypothetical protein BXZ70DRAFT_1053127 [Cristinia sonorae]